MPTFDSLKSEYTDLWTAMKIQPERTATVDAIARKLVANRDKYLAVQKTTGVPWFVIAAWHNRESDADFDTQLAQGDPLDSVSVNEPSGRGPFDTWEDGAFDALVTLKHLDQIKEWSPARICYETERYNGFGYRNNHPDLESPYLWSFTTHYAAGKYVADGQFSASAVDKQCGAIPIIKSLMAFVPAQRPQAPASWLSVLVGDLLALFRRAPTKPPQPPVPPHPADVQPHIRVARKLIGTREETDEGNRLICGWMRELGGSIAKYFKTGNARTIPWCAGFIGWCLHSSGFKFLDSLLALDYAKYGVKLDGPAVGAIGPMGRDGGGHVAFVIGRDQHGNIMCIGGNQSNSVCVKPFQQSRFVAFRWPPELPMPKTGFDQLPVLDSDGDASRDEA